jgi:hypothetical protein
LYGFVTEKKLCVFSFIAVNAKILSGGLQFSSIITINKSGVKNQIQSIIQSGSLTLASGLSSQLQIKLCGVHSDGML